MLRLAPAAAIAVLAGPVAFGLLATLLPAFGYLPAIGGDALTLEPWRQLLAEPGIWRSAGISLIAGVVTTAVSVTLAAAFLAGWSHTRAFAVLQHAISPLLSVPHAAAALGLAFLLAPSGWLMRLVSPELTGFTRPPDWLVVNDPMGLAMMAGLVVKELPFVFLVALAALPQARPREHAAIAQSLGYGRMAGFLHTTWPLVYPQIRLAVFAVVAYSSSVVDMAIILGPTQPAPLAVRLVGWMNDPDLSMRFKASAGAVLQLGVTAAALLLWIALEKLAGAVLRGLCGSGRRMRREVLPRHLAAAAVLGAAIFAFAGLAVLALWSIAGPWNFPDALPQSFTLKNWMRHWEGLSRPLAITLAVGLASTAAALLLTLAVLEREARSPRSRPNSSLWLLYLPLIVPQASFVFGLQLFLLGAGFDRGFLPLALAHLVFVLPYVFLSFSDPWRSWDTRYARAASAMGAGPSAIFWRIRLPMLLKPLLVAAAVGLAVSVGQYLPTLLIGAGRWPTVTTEAVALASGGDRRIAAIYAFAQLVLPFIGFALAAMIPALLFANRRGMRPA